MHKRFDPFEGMSPVEKAQAIYKPNKTYDDDIVELINFVGGKDNINNVRHATKEDLSKLAGFDNTSKFVLIDVKDIKKTGFICDCCNNTGATECCCCSLRTFNACLDCFRFDQDIFVEYKEPMKGFMNSWVDFYKELDLNKEEEIIKVAKKLNEN